MSDAPVFVFALEQDGPCDISIANRTLRVFTPEEAMSRNFVLCGMTLAALRLADHAASRI